MLYLYVDGQVKEDEARQIVMNWSLRVLACAMRSKDCSFMRATRMAEGTLAVLFDQGCSVFGCDVAKALDARVQAIGLDDYGVEYLDKILAAKVVKDLDEAMTTSRASARVTRKAFALTNEAHRERFLEEVDAVCVLANTSARAFTTGGALGLGREAGIATSRIHWRGPMGLDSAYDHEVGRAR